MKNEKKSKQKSLIWRMFYIWILCIVMLLIISILLRVITIYRNNKYSSIYLEKANVNIEEKKYNEASYYIRTSVNCAKKSKDFDIKNTYREIIRMYLNEEYTEAKGLISTIKEMEGFDYEKYRIDILEEDINFQIEEQE